MQDRWTPGIDEITRNFRDAFGALTYEQLNWKPDVTQWSIGQIIDHLITVNASYYPILDAVHAGTYKQPFLGKFNFMTRFFGRIILKSVDPSNLKKTKTLSLWEPDQSDIPANTLEVFEQSQEKLKSIITRSLEVVDPDYIINSPANRNIVYRIETAFDVIVNHERRHFRQAQNVLAAQNN